MRGALKAPTFCSHILYIKAKPQIIFSADISGLVAAATGASYLIHVRIKVINLVSGLSEKLTTFTTYLPVSIYLRNTSPHSVTLELKAYAIDHKNRGTQRQFSEKICSEDDWRTRIFLTFVVKLLACLPFLGFSNI